MDVLLAAVEILTAVTVLAVAHFPLETTRSLLNFGAAPIVRYAHRQKLRTINLEIARARETLGRLMNEGRLVLARLRDPMKDAEASRSYAQAWTAQVEEFLQNEFGRLYVDRFRSRCEGTDVESAGVPPERLPDWKNLRDCVSNLELLSAEL
ncbi:hypothetical protein QA645_32005 [Bradyrhizobium sp. CIAT3101]|uniref:hypothetical protein n=1 Tax=Bradyrhizobium sp. CIAT3101 TaxID=439387 RepID=UPI0024B23B4D|nr:hypothetical protein [Bradyrhizobium sp. CIAT3101]WFU79120.1 hypothetical protein QA645_32005 [Bradyrhizobium sp. CIAT3101]